jgi:hypothetical protein
MSEFKFACPVCGQHITADSSTSGTRLDCPTCFRPIVVPQAPASTSKLILAAAQPAKERPKSPGTEGLGPLRKTSHRMSPTGVAVLLFLAGAAGLCYFFWPELRDWAKRMATPLTAPTQGSPVEHADTPPPPLVNGWTLDLNRAAIPDKPAAGTIHGQAFTHEQASLTGGALSLRQGRGWPPDLAMAIILPAQRGEELSGRTIQVLPEHTLPAPQVILRWKDQDNQPQQQDLKGGYLMQLVFGYAATGRITGKIYLALPDEDKSVVAGTFTAEIKAARPK